MRAANAESFVRELPEGIDSVTGERGTRLSGGERQRISIARALLGDERLVPDLIESLGESDCWISAAAVCRSLGWVGDARVQGEGRATTLTPGEQYSYMSMWCLMAAPLIFSGDMTRLPWRRWPHGPRRCSVRAAMCWWSIPHTAIKTR